MLIRRHRTPRIRAQTLRICDPELLSDEHRHTAGNRRRVLAQERAKHPHRPPLDSEPQPILIPTLALQQPRPLCVQPEEPLQIVSRRVPGEPPIPRDLLVRQELDWHRRPAYA